MRLKKTSMHSKRFDLASSLVAEIVNDRAKLVLPHS
jgi:hypothetical protein